MTENDLKLALKAVKAAKKLGVISMKLGTIEFELEPQDGSTRVRRSTSKVSAKKIKEVEDENQLSLEVREIRDDLSTMHVENPEGFERALVENLLEDGGEKIGETTEDAHVT